MESSDVDKRAKEIKELDLDRESLPIERTLGLQWTVSGLRWQSRRGHSQTGYIDSHKLCM